MDSWRVSLITTVWMVIVCSDLLSLGIRDWYYMGLRVVFAELVVHPAPVFNLGVAVPVVDPKGIPGKCAGYITCFWVEVRVGAVR